MHSKFSRVCLNGALLTSVALASRVNPFASAVSAKKFATMSTPYLPPICASACADVYMMRMFDDNYGYVIVDPETKKAATVDPGEPQAVMNALGSIDCTLEQLLTTHKHMDHSGGNAAFASTFPKVDIIGTKYEDIPAITKPVGDGDTFMLGALKVHVIYTPCHTKGHVVYYITGQRGSPVLFSGDTLFVGGCGRFFEGTPDEMLKNMDRLTTLPRDTLVFCAHEYTESNFKFLANVDPDTCGAKYLEIKEVREKGGFTVPSTIGDELQTNLFMQCRTERVQQLLDCAGSPVDTMGALRSQKNSFR